MSEALVVAVSAGIILGAATTASAQATLQYYHLDGIGSVRAVTDAAGSLIERHDYMPFGEECTTGTCASNPGLAAGQPKKFTGKERDSETDLDYFGARYYASKIGRFASVDPKLNIQESLTNPQKWNRYAYGLNNPLRYVDPDGREEYLYVQSNVAKSGGAELTAGHANLVRFNSDTNATTTYGLWPDAHPDIVGAGLANGTGSDVRTNVSNDNPAHYPFKFGVELTPAQSAALDAAVARPSDWGYTNTCASWAAATFTGVTGVRMAVSELAGITGTPRRLGDSIKAKVAGNANAGVFPPGPAGAPGPAPAPAPPSSGVVAQNGPRRPLDQR